MAVWLRKAELAERAAKWGLTKDVVFTEALLSEWIDEALLAKGDRRGNKGNKPVFVYGYQHYRRTLQIIRLYSRGIKNKDAILILLFLSGYGIKPYQIREPLLKEMAKSRRVLNAQLRSTRFDETGEVPPKHKASLFRSIGNPDFRFSQAGIAPDAETLLRATRAMRSPDPDLKVEKIKGNDPRLIDLIINSFAGFLSQDDEYPNKWDNLVSEAKDPDLLKAREIVILIRDALCNSPQLSVSFAPAAEAFRIAFAQRYFSAFLLVQGLLFQQDSIFAEFKETAPEPK